MPGLTLAALSVKIGKVALRPNLSWRTEDSAMMDTTHPHRCFALMRPDGGWSRWLFAPDNQNTYDILQKQSGKDVLFKSVQVFPPIPGMAGRFKWGKVSDIFRNENALPHIAPLYFDVDCEGGIQSALLLTQAIYEFFTGRLGIDHRHMGIWFSGSKGAHLFVASAALGIEPSPKLTEVMKFVALSLCKKLVSEGGVPDLMTDQRVYSMPRLLRCENQLNPKSNLYKIRLYPEELATCDADKIMKLAASPRDFVQPEGKPVISESATKWWQQQLEEARKPEEFKKQAAKISGIKYRPDGFMEDKLVTTDMPPCIKLLLESHPHAGSRNRTELQLACWARAAKKDKTEATNLLGKWIAANRPEMTYASAMGKARGIINSAWSGKYGFSCAASLAALSHVDTGDICTSCPSVNRQHPKMVSAVRTATTEPVELSRITLEEARDRAIAIAQHICAC